MKKVTKIRSESLTLALMSFDFAFVTQLLVTILGITNELNMAL